MNRLFWIISHLVIITTVPLLVGFQLTMYEINPPVKIKHSVKASQPKLGVIDRFEGNQWAVILIDEWMAEIVVDQRALPPAAEVNTWLNLDYADDQIVNMTVNHAKTAEQLKITHHLKRKLLKK